MFDPEGGSNRAGRQNPRKPSNDDPIILNVETDGGDGPQPSSNVPPKRPSGPRITSKPNRPRKPSNGSKIFIGVVLADCSSRSRSSSPMSCGTASSASKA
mgnify:CR=1 FL=1